MIRGIASEVVPEPAEDPIPRLVEPGRPLTGVRYGLGGSIRSTVWTLSSDRSNDAASLIPVLSAHATR